MPQLLRGLLPLHYDQICWNESCGSTNLDQTRLQVCNTCRVARYCSRACQNNDWARHRTQCDSASSLHSISRQTVRTHDTMQIEHRQEFPDDALGLVVYETNLNFSPTWRFMRLSIAPEWLTRARLFRLPKAEWQVRLAQREIEAALRSVWHTIFIGRAQGVRMVPEVDDSGGICLRDMTRFLTARDAVRCVLQLAPLGLALTLATRPSRAVREQVHNDGIHDTAFICTPFSSCKLAASQDWDNIVHVWICALGV